MHLIVKGGENFRSIEHGRINRGPFSLCHRGDVVEGAKLDGVRLGRLFRPFMQRHLRLPVALPDIGQVQEGGTPMSKTRSPTVKSTACLEQAHTQYRAKGKAFRSL